MGSVKERMFEAIARRLTNDGLKDAVLAAAESRPPIDLHQELETISLCIEKVNELILGSDDDNNAGIKNTKRILSEHGFNQIPNPFIETSNQRSMLRSLLNVIDVGNTEISNDEEKRTYMDPKKINNGNPLSIFRWYLYDGVGRMMAIHLGISNDDKGQEREGDWIGCALTEAAVALAEEGDRDAQGVVKDMINMGFIAKGWLLTDQLVERAQEVTVALEKFLYGLKSIDVLLAEKTEELAVPNEGMTRPRPIKVSPEKAAYALGNAFLAWARNEPGYGDRPPTTIQVDQLIGELYKLDTPHTIAMAQALENNRVTFMRNPSV
ncbi:MAG: hypothetical protein UU09_C0042G0007 [Microgenomates group bacterium GW2011_GWA2_40_6]|nr:MAG: hypothetical protein UU09_C0042G0007 [Microgenomates group bacterium GW2011_GWA2_40_6]